MADFGWSLFRCIAILCAFTSCQGGPGSVTLSDPSRDSVGLAIYPVSAFDDASCNNFISAFDGIKYPRVSVLYGTFGTSVECLKRWSDSLGRPHEILIHGQNETCRRAYRCESTEVAHNLTVREFSAAVIRPGSYAENETKRRVKEIERFISFFDAAQVTIKVSTGLEHNYTQAAAKRVYELYSALEVMLVDNPVHPVGAVPGAIYELHNDHTPDTTPCAWSNDGFDVLFSARTPTAPLWSIDKLRREVQNTSHCDRYVWVNVQDYRQSRFLPPSQRRIEMSLTEAESLNRFMKEFEK